jgi:UDP-4-amino-4,6-dideoxy-N-acetyl-beta-L-altrosamine transaminase
MIPYGRQDINQTDIDAVVEVLRSDFLTQGPKVPLFEKMVAEYCGAKHAVAVNSATSALHIACLALGLGKGDRLWTTPITFVASANCGLYCGAEVDFVDIDPHTYNLSPRALEAKLVKAEKEKTLPKIVVAVHLCGQSCDMESIYRLSRKYGFSVIEDASHAIGGKYKNKPIGSCRYSDIAIFSFHPVKIITTAEGGMALTNEKALSAKMELLRSHGITRDPELMTQAPDGPWYYQQIDLGFNYRMTDLQAALGISQLARLDKYVSRRHELSRHYNEALKNLPLTLPWQHPDSYSGLHLYVIRLQREESSITHRELFEALRYAEIGVNVHYIPVHIQPYYQQKGFQIGDFPEAEAYYEDAISLPLYPALSDDWQEEVMSTLKNILQ